MLQDRLRALTAEVERHPDDPHAWEELARLLGRAGRDSQELEALLRGLRHHPHQAGLKLRARRVLAVTMGVLGDPRLQHAEYVRAVAVSPRGDLLASAGDDRVIRLWDLETGLARAVLRGHTKAVRCLDFSPDGARLASGSVDRSVRLWDVDRALPLHRMTGHGKSVFSCAFSPDGGRLVTGSADTTCRLWDLETGTQVARMGGSLFAVQSCAFSPDGRYVISGSLDRSLTLWHARTGRPLGNFHGHRGWVQCCAFLPGGSRVVSGSQDRTLRIWERATGQEVMRMVSSEGPVLSCAVSPGGAWLVAGTKDGSVTCFDASTGDPRWTRRVHRGPVHSTAFGGRGELVVTGGADGCVEVLRALDGEPALVPLGPRGHVTACFFMPGGNEVACASRDRTLRFYETATGAERQTLAFPHLDILCGGTDARGTALAVAGRDARSGPDRARSGTCEVWFPDRPLVETVLAGHRHSVTTLALSGSGDRLATGGEDRVVSVWELPSGRCLHGLEGHEGTVLALAFGPLGRFLATGSEDGRVRILDLQRGAALQLTLDLESPAEALAFLEDPGGGAGAAPVLAVGCRDGTLSLHESRGGNPLASLPLEAGAVLSLAHRAGLLLVGTAERGAHLLRWTRGGLEELTHLEGPVGPVQSCDLSPRLDRLVYAQGCHLRVAEISQAALTTRPPRR